MIWIIVNICHSFDKNNNIKTFFTGSINIEMLFEQVDE